MSWGAGPGGRGWVAHDPHAWARCLLRPAVSGCASGQHRCASCAWLNSAGCRVSCRAEERQGGRRRACWPCRPLQAGRGGDRGEAGGVPQGAGGQGAAGGGGAGAREVSWGGRRARARGPGGPSCRRAWPQQPALQAMPSLALHQALTAPAALRPAGWRTRRTRLRAARSSRWTACARHLGWGR